MLAKFTKTPQKTLVGIMIVGVLLRIGTSVLFFGNDVQSLPGIFDEVSYHNLAIRVLEGHGFSFGEAWWPGTPANEPTAHWSYLYTSYLIGLYALIGPNPIVARIIQGIFTGILMPLVTYRLANRVFEKPYGAERAQTIALIAAGITAVYIYLFYYAAALITESVYILGIVWTFDIAVKISQQEEPTPMRDWLLFGVALALTTLLRQLFLLFAPFMLIWLWWAKRPQLWKLAIPLVITAVFMAPWTYRNYQAFDTLVPLNTNSGHAFFWGNHPSYGTQFVPILPTRQYYAMIPEELKAQGLNEAEMDSALLELGVGFVVEDPGRYVLLSLSRFPSYFKFWPSAESGFVSNLSRVASFGLFLPFMIWGIVIAARQSSPSWKEWLASPFTLFYLFVLVYTGMHVLTWTLIRYRIPIDAIFILFAGLALERLFAMFGLWGERPYTPATQSNM